MQQDGRGGSASEDGNLPPPWKKLKLSLGRSCFSESMALEFQDWKSAISQKVEEEQCPGDLLGHPDPVQINFWLSKFVMEVRKQNGQVYPPHLIQLVVSTLQRKMLHKNPEAPKLMNQFVTGLHRTCDSVYHELHKEGIGATVRQTAFCKRE